MNLLDEAITLIEHYKKSVFDIEYISDGIGYISWDEFKKIADIEYRDDYINTNNDELEINTKIKIVSKNWWLERQFNHIFEYWKYREIPDKSELILSNRESFQLRN